MCIVCSFCYLQVLVLSEADNPDLLKAAVVSVGLLGVVTEVSLRIEPIFNLHETLEVCLVGCIGYTRHWEIHCVHET